MSTPIFTPEDRMRLFEARLCSPYGIDPLPGEQEVHSEHIRRIHLHNGVLPSELVAQLGGEPQRVAQYNPREPLYIVDDALHIPQYSGVHRQSRYEHLCNAWVTAKNDTTPAPDQPVTFTSHRYQGQLRYTVFRYDNLAHDYVSRVLVFDPKYQDSRVFPAKELREAGIYRGDLTDIVFGPLESVRRVPGCKVIATASHDGIGEYLDAQIVQFRGRPILNLGYMYGDQTGRIVEKLARDYADLVSCENLPKQRLRVMMFGRVGGIKEGLARHDIIAPTEITYVDKLHAQNLEVRSLDNHLQDIADSRGCIMDIPIILEETVEDLRVARSRGIVGVEMELWEVNNALDQVRSRYPEYVDIQFGFLGHVSDCPLEFFPNGTRDTVLTELDSSKGEDLAARAIIEYLVNS